MRDREWIWDADIKGRDVMGRKVIKETLGGLRRGWTNLLVTKHIENKSRRTVLLYMLLV